ncbi:hypothetical protein [Marinobacter nauticus]|uniref:Uncharacterized protein n=1 Tax=Marinobacter nauticus TaxID=2743 RepID=A0A833NAP4_MARNT|nr:hypothetical protein [Marinobacter nauticus]KAE8545360.1 hypothetical protein F6453_2332 [Marinobacter nauticus]
MNEQQLAELIEAIRQQTDAINRLASSNAALVQAMAEAEGFDEEGDGPHTYLDESTLD